VFDECFLASDALFLLRHIVGLYVDPPHHAIVLSIDEKSQIQALDRTQRGDGDLSRPLASAFGELLTPYAPQKLLSLCGGQFSDRDFE
jgi:hypothetical protein